MIKELIEDLAFDKINLSQALTRAKIIAYKIKNSKFKDWLDSEINGYKQKELPPYRIVKCDIFAELFMPFAGTTRTVPFDISKLDSDLDLEYSFYEMRITQSIGTLEAGLNKDKMQDYGYEYFPQGLVSTLAKMTEQGDSITAVKRRVQFSQIEYVIQQTKQKLLDTLLELNDVFKNLENDFKNTDYNDNMVKTIINQNIYGDNSNSNIGIGNNISQLIDDHKKIEKLVTDLKSLGLEDADINEVQEIIKNEPKSSVGKNLLSWVGKMSSKAVEKGIELQIPNIIEKIQDFI